jgi:hypothetical protein
VRRERPRGEKGDAGDRRACRGVEEEWFPVATITSNTKSG